MTQVNDSHFSIRYVLIIPKSGLDGSHPHANDTLQLVHSRGYDLGTRRHRSGTYTYLLTKIEGISAAKYMGPITLNSRLSLEVQQNSCRYVQ